MRESSVDIVLLIQIFSSDISRDKFIDLCEQINDATREFLLTVHDIHCDIIQNIPQENYRQLADAYEIQLLPYLKPEKCPLNIHLIEYIEYLRRLDKEGDNVRTIHSKSFIDDMLRIPEITEKSQKEN